MLDKMPSVEILIRITVFLWSI